MSTHTLLLTPWYAPHQIIGWQEAICKVVTGDAEVIAEYDEIVRSPSMEMKIPSVLRLTPKKPLKAVRRGAKYSWANILTRDNYTCQYCGKTFHAKHRKHLNRDHVVPKAKGGKTGWENIVAACKTCNSKKDCKTPEQAGMPLLRQPYRPTTLPLAAPFLGDTIPKAWEPYLNPNALPDVG